MSLRLLLLCALSTPLALSCVYHDDSCDTSQNYGAAEEADPQPGMRNPSTGECQYFGGGGGTQPGHCDEYQSDVEGNQAPLPDWGICDGACESLAESECLASTECRGIYTTPQGIPGEDNPQFYQCWFISTNDPYPGDGCSTYAADECARHSECVAVHRDSDVTTGPLFGFCSDPFTTEPDPGSCVGEVACDAEPPACPPDTVPGRIDACWSGYCIPIQDCDVIPECFGSSEDTCVGRSDCDPVYQGVDCSCDGDTCTCAEWNYESCQSL